MLNSMFAPVPQSAMLRTSDSTPYVLLMDGLGGPSATRHALRASLFAFSCCCLWLLSRQPSPTRASHALVDVASQALGAASLGHTLDVSSGPRPPWGDCPWKTQGSPHPWCDVSKSASQRAAALVDAMTVEEKSRLLENKAGAIPRVGIPAYDWWSEGLHGLARAGTATSFPQVIGLAASFNTSLWRTIGRAIGMEARGRNNKLDGELYHGLTIWSPNVNIFRDPRWGRGQETPGEDPLVASAYAQEFVSGLQGDEGEAGYLLTSACLKHFAAYTAEGANEHERLSYKARVNAQDMADTELPPFRDGVLVAHASGLMCAYSAPTYGRGSLPSSSLPSSDETAPIPSCANQYLFEDLARGEWGFDGYVTTDCGAAVGLTQRHHKYTRDVNETVEALLRAGVDTSCGPPYYPAILGTPDMMQSVISPPSASLGALLDRAATRLLAVQMRLGFFDSAEHVAYARLGEESVNTPEHRALALDAAQQSLVLLKNAPLAPSAPTAARALPLSRADVRSVAVIGELADEGMNLLGNYYGEPFELVTPLDGVRAYAPTVAFDSGVDVAKAAAVARTADAVVVVVGLRSEAGAGRLNVEMGGEVQMDEAEGKDRTSLLLPRNQTELLREVSAVAAASRRADGTPVPVVAVIISGGCVDVSEFESSPDVHAMIWAGYPGQAGGTAIASTLWGDANPSGRLAVTWYRDRYVQEVPMAEMSFRPIDAAPALPQHPGRTHRFYSGPMLYAFGHGLSYTQWRTQARVVQRKQPLPADQLQWADANQLRAAIVATVEVSVQHLEGPAGTEVVLLFARPPEGVAGYDGAPIQMLVGFERVPTAWRTTETVLLDVSALALSYASREGGRVLPRGHWLFWVGPNGPQAPDVSTVTLALS